MGANITNKQKALKILKNVNLTEKEKRSFEWLLGWENNTVENICNIILKVKQCRR